MELGSQSLQSGDISVDRLIRSFANLLRLCWSEIEQTSQYVQMDSYLEDWLQANWEMFVEGALPPGTFLRIYGDGADCNGASSRVWMPDAVATHQIICLPKTEKMKVVDRLNGGELDFGTTGLPFDRLVTIEESKYSESPPFDHAFFDPHDGPDYRDLYAAHIDDLRFLLARHSGR